MTSHVFLSYAGEDQVVAMRLCAALEAGGLACWIAPRNIRPAEPWASAIVRAIEGAGATVLILSRHSLASRQVTREIELSDNSGKPVLAVHIDESKLAGELEYFLLDVQWREVPQGALEKEIPPLVEAVRGLLSPDSLDKASALAETGASGRTGPLRWLGGELRRGVAAWLGVISRGPAFIGTLELDDLRTVMFSLRFLVYMQLVSALLAWSLQYSVRADPVGYALGYVMSGSVETFGAVLVFHACFRMLRGAASFQKSANVCLLYSAFGPLTTLCLSPVRSYLEPVFRVDFSKASPEQVAQAFAAQWTVFGIVIVLACALGSTIVVAWSFTGMLRSLRMVHHLNVPRSFLAMTGGAAVYLLYLLVVGTPFERALYGH